MLNGEVDRESHLFLSSGPPLAKAWDENLGAQVGGFRSGGALLGALTLNVECKTLALTSSSYKKNLRFKISSSDEPSSFKNLIFQKRDPNSTKP